MSSRKPRLIASRPVELLVYDEPTNCPYLPDETARLPMRLPARPLDREEFAERLRVGDRRQGLVLYRPSCETCRACEAIRIDVSVFTESRSQRRCLKRGRESLRMEIGPACVDNRRVELYNLHKRGRNLLGDGDPIDVAGYHAFLVESCTESFEMRYYLADKLVGIAVVDRADDALSAVYTYFDPQHESLSPGTYSILEQLSLCRKWDLRYLYLGLYVHGCDTMAYKARFLPHERRIGGVWRLIEQSSELKETGS
jgi:arginine-tRNA-protein transferase